MTYINFNPRFPRGKRQSFRQLTTPPLLFQSTLPAREATPIPGILGDDKAISIHASREGSDNAIIAETANKVYFNPRFPRGKRLQEFLGFRVIQEISIHASREGSDQGVHASPQYPYHISIHASREGSDAIYCRLQCRRRYFNPRFPRGKRRYRWGFPCSWQYFNPRFPRGKRLLSL